ncbi:MAG: hypothetical protein H5U02_05575 [Clostridia bacterium]|nr:hypothetical protein [Clostridia bacterium]
MNKRKEYSLLVRRMRGYRLREWCRRAGVDPLEADLACLAAVRELGRRGFYGHQALLAQIVDVRVKGRKWRVGFEDIVGDEQYYWAVQLPFRGWSEEGIKVPPMIG